MLGRGAGLATQGRALCSRATGTGGELNGYYPTGIKITKEQLAALNIKSADFHGDWNYEISPYGKEN